MPKKNQMEEEAWQLKKNLKEEKYTNSNQLLKEQAIFLREEDVATLDKRR